MRQAVRVVTVLLFLTATVPSPSSADWLLTPFVGSGVGGSTNIVGLAGSAGEKKLVFGSSVALLGDGFLGVEADVGHSPHFFDTARGTLVQRSTVTTLTGNLIAAVPRAITRDSLRPYAVAGVGLMHASSTDVLRLFSFDSNLLALDVGGGAVGMLGRRTGLRFELRQFRNLRPASQVATTTSGSTRLRFLRATIGLTLRY